MIPCLPLHWMMIPNKYKICLFGHFRFFWCSIHMIWFHMPWNRYKTNWKNYFLAMLSFVQNRIWATYKIPNYVSPRFGLLTLILSKKKCRKQVQTIACYVKWPVVNLFTTSMTLITFWSYCENFVVFFLHLF